jgi:bifunctional non-homologous end joining protein LigD
VALWLRELLDDLGLDSVVKTSGSKGMQVYVPLNTEVTYNDTKLFSHALAQLLEQREPKLVVSQMTKELRKGKVFIDWSQNDQVKTTVCVYSLRAREQPTVSAPMTWDEVEQLRAGGDPDGAVLTAGDVLARVADIGDPFAPVLELEQHLPRQPAAG